MLEALASGARVQYRCAPPRRGARESALSLGPVALYNLARRRTSDKSDCGENRAAAHAADTHVDRNVFRSQTSEWPQASPLKSRLSSSSRGFRVIFATTPLVGRRDRVHRVRRRLLDHASRDRLTFFDLRRRVPRSHQLPPSISRQHRHFLHASLAPAAQNTIPCSRARSAHGVRTLADIRYGVHSS